MHENEIRTAITQYLSRTGKSFTADTDLFEANVIDSMGVLELVAFIDNQLHISLEQGDLVIENFRSVNDMVKTLCRIGK
jgi:acyl carrier protein